VDSVASGAPVEVLVPVGAAVVGAAVVGAAVVGAAVVGAAVVRLGAGADVGAADVGAFVPEHSGEGPWSFGIREASSYQR